MVSVRRHRRVRVFIVIGVSSMLLLAACGGGNSSKPAGAPTTSAGGAETSTTAATNNGNGNCVTTPGKQRARVRFVNLFTNPTYPNSDIDVMQGFSGSDPCGKKLATVAFGRASDYIDVTAGDTSGNWEVAGYVGGSTATDHQIITQSETWKGGEQVTIVFEGAEAQSGLPAGSGGDQVFFENGSQGDLSGFTTVAGKAVVGIAATSLQYVVKDGAWSAGVAGQSGCLRAVGDTATTTSSIGGTELVQYLVAPGSMQLGLYPSDPGTCTGTPNIGPATIDAAAGSRTYVFAYGQDAQHLKLLVLPVAS